MGAPVKPIIAIAALAALSACTSTPIIGRLVVPSATRAEELGSINLAVVSVTPWEEVAPLLQTDFKLEGQAALLQAVIPRTSSSLERVVDLLAFKIAADIQGTKFNDTSQSSRSDSTKGVTGEDGNRVQTATDDQANSISRSRTRTTPTIPTSDVGTPESLRSLAEKLTTTATGAAPTGLDVFTQFRAAAALQQELVALNRSVKDAVSRTGYVPYLVRVQFGVNPNRRDQPIDSRMRVSFVPRTEVSNAVGDATHTTDQPSNQSDLPIVVPLIATDNLEAADEQYAAERLRQASASLGFAAGILGVKGGFNRTLSRQIDTFGSSMNSLYSVGRENDNTLVARVGALRIGNRYEMVARTVTSTILLLVPQEQVGSIIDVISRPSFYNARTGESLTLGQFNSDGYVEMRPYLYEQFCFSSNEKDDVCRRVFHDLADSVRSGESMKAFSAKLSPQGRGNEVPTVGCWVGPRQNRKDFQNVTNFERPNRSRSCLLTLWGEMQRLSERLHVASVANFEVRRAVPWAMPPAQLAKFVKDTNGLMVSLAMADPKLSGKVGAYLSDRNSCIQSLPSNLFAKSISYSGQNAAFGFDNLEPLKQKRAATSNWNFLCLYPLVSSTGQAEQGYVLREPATPALAATTATASPVKVSISSRGATLYPVRGAGETTVFIEWDGDLVGGVEIVAENATIVGAAGDAVSFDRAKRAVRVTSKGAVDLGLGGISRDRYPVLKATAFEKAGWTKALGSASDEIRIVREEIQAQ